MLLRGHSLPNWPTDQKGWLSLESLEEQSALYECLEKVMDIIPQPSIVSVEDEEPFWGVLDAIPSRL